MCRWLGEREIRKAEAAVGKQISCWRSSKEGMKVLRAKSNRCFTLCSRDLMCFYFPPHYDRLGVGVRGEVEINNQIKRSFGRKVIHWQFGFCPQQWGRKKASWCRQERNCRFILCCANICFTTALATTGLCDKASS